MSETPFFSIIVPVYQTERFLEQCLESLLNQSYNNFEALLVNDGSPGNSHDEWYKDQDIGRKFTFDHTLTENIQNQSSQCKHIFDMLCGDDDRFHYIEIPNSGVSVARNTGIQNAMGVYLQFIDSDDWVLPDHLNNIKTVIENTHSSQPTIFFSEIRESYNSKRQIRKRIPSPITLPSLGYSSFIWSWNTVYLREVIEKYAIRFDDRLGYGAKIYETNNKSAGMVSHKREDLLFNFEYSYRLYQKNNFNDVQYVAYSQSYMYRDVDENKKSLADTEIQGKMMYTKYLYKKYRGSQITIRTKVTLALNYFLHTYISNKWLYGIGFASLTMFAGENK